MTSNELELGATVQIEKTGAIGRVVGRSEVGPLRYYVQIGDLADWHDRAEIKRASVFEAMAADDRELQNILDAGDMAHPRWQAAREMNDQRLAADDTD